MQSRCRLSHCTAAHPRPEPSGERERGRERRERGSGEGAQKGEGGERGGKEGRHGTKTGGSGGGESNERRQVKHGRERSGFRDSGSGIGALGSTSGAMYRGVPVCVVMYDAARFSPSPTAPAVRPPPRMGESKWDPARCIEEREEEQEGAGRRKC
jgi:hypothetical protein